MKWPSDAKLRDFLPRFDRVEPVTVAETRDWTAGERKLTDYLLTKGWLSFTGYPGEYRVSSAGRKQLSLPCEGPK